MENGKSVGYYMRFIHRYVGYFCLGLVFVYALSGIVLVYRDTNFMKREKHITQTLQPFLSAEELNNELKIKNFKVVEQTGDVIKFADGTYNTQTGEVNYTQRKLVFPFNKFTELHKCASGRSSVHIFGVIFGVSMFLLALTSIWMVRKRTKYYISEVVFISAGVAIAIALLLIV